MAYTKSPSQDTYSTEDIDLSREIVSRSGGAAKDEDYVNFFIEHIKSKQATDTRTFIFKRAGSSNLITSATTGTIRGSAYWEDQQKLYYAVGSNIYVYNFTNSTTTTLTPSPWNSSGTVGFAEFIYNDGTTGMILSNGTTILQIDTSNTITYCIDGDLPTPHDPNIIFIDGYLLTVKVGTGDIYNSDNNAPFSWTPGNFINAEIEADTVLRLFKVSNYIVAAGKETLEYFWDAAIATGSPFQRNDTPVKRISFLSAYAQEQNASFFVGKELNGDIQVYKLYDFKCDPISTPTISRYLNTLGIDYNTWTGNVISFQGHKFYVINAGNYTYSMDLETMLWSRMAYKAAVNFNFARAHGVRTATANTSVFSLNDGTSAWYKFDESLGQDSSSNYTCTIVTDADDFGTGNRKSMHRVILMADRPAGDSLIGIQTSDDDYQTYSTLRTTNLNQDSVSLRQLGSFRQRAFKLTYTDTYPLRIQKLSVDINKGSS